MNEPNLDWTAIVAERKIQEAIEAGEFDNLELAGKPINLDDNPFETVEQRITNRILKNAGALPEWIQMEQDIRREIDAVGPARERGLRTIRFARNRPTCERAAARLRDDIRERMEFVNTLLLKYNMNAPGSVQRPFHRFKKAEEMSALEEAITAAIRESAAEAQQSQAGKRK